MRRNSSPHAYARTPEEADIIARALKLLEREARRLPPLSSQAAVRDYLRLELAGRERESFWCIWVDAQHRAIGFEELFAGTLTKTSVWPREVVKAALRINAAAVIFAHNHPSGSAEPSEADQSITKLLAFALELIDVQVLDHFIVGAGCFTAFTERGLMP